MVGPHLYRKNQTNCTCTNPLSVSKNKSLKSRENNKNNNTKIKNILKETDNVLKLFPYFTLNNFELEIINSNYDKSEEFIENTLTTEDNLEIETGKIKIFYMNIRSLQKNIDHLHTLLTQHKITPDVIALTETWMSKTSFLTLI